MKMSGMNAPSTVWRDDIKPEANSLAVI